MGGFDYTSLAQRVAEVINAQSLIEGGGGGGSSSLLQIIHDFSQPAITPEAGSMTVSLSATIAGGAFTRDQGDDLSWAVGDPTKITVNTTGYYDIIGTAQASAGTEAMTFAVQLKVNGSTVAAMQRVEGFVSPTMTVTGGTPTPTARGEVLTYPLTAGDYIEFDLAQVGNTTQDNGLQLFTAVVRKVA